MIGWIFRAAAAAMVYFCVGTVIAQAILIAYAGSAWKLDRDTLLRAWAVLRNVDLEAIEESVAEKELPSSEQPSFQAVVEARALKIRDLELREQALRDGMTQIQFERTRLAEEQTRYKRNREEFETRLAKLQDGEVAEGYEEVRAKLESLKPDQAKLLLAQMLDKDEMDAVVRLLSEMSNTKSSKIMEQFQTPQEIEQLDEILRRIRQGAPVAQLAERTQRALEETP